MRRGCQSIYSNSGELLFEGEWDPLALYNTLTGRGGDSFWAGKRVLDIGANTCGLSIEIARRGAEVVSLEPDPHNVTFALAKTIVDDLVSAENLNLRVWKKGLFEAHEFKGYDVVLCLGLLYHFRYPQFTLDYLSSLEMQWLFLSTQVHPGDDLCLVNRVDPRVKFPIGFFSEPTILTGWHPTRPLLERMLLWAGFEEIESLTEKPYVFPEKQRGLTNSAYYKALRVRTIDPFTAMSQFYPR